MTTNDGVMMMKIRMFAALLLFSSPLLAGELAAQSVASGIVFPDTFRAGEQELLLNGTGTRRATLFRVRVYAAALYVTERTSDAERIVSSTTPSVLILHFLRSVEADSVQDAWEEGLEKNARDFEAVKPALARFNAHMVDLKEGDRIQITFFPNEKISVSVAGGEIFEVLDRNLPAELLRVWFGSHPPNEDLKRGLLGLSSR